ncbi:MAG: hypothetical protein AMXMBFR76_11320 [Pseudomonadota bacterium]
MNGLSPIPLAKLANGAGNVVEPGATGGWLAFIIPGRDLTRSRHSPHALRPGTEAMCFGHSDCGFCLASRDDLVAHGPGRLLGARAAAKSPR